MLVEVYDDAAPMNKSCKEWLFYFKNVDFSIEENLCSGKPKKFGDKHLEALLNKDQNKTRVSCRVIGRELTSRYRKIEIHENN